MTRVRDIANILGVTEAANPTNEVLLWEAAGGGGVTVYATKEDLPSSGLTSGDQAYVTANSRFYISNGSGWYNVALINATPSLTIDPTGAIELSTEGATTTITLTATDSDNAVAGLTYSVESDGSFGGLATISQDSSVFTITPLSEDSATTETSTLTFKASDGISFGSGQRTFTLTFSSIIANSNYTTLLLKNEETSDNQVDASTNALTITENGNVTSTALSPYHPGGYSTYFDGTDDHLTVTDNISLNVGTGDFTVEAWFYLNADDGSYNICSQFASGNTGGIWLGRYANGFVFRRGGIADVITASSLPSVGEWHHVAVSRADGSTKMFIDGTQTGSTVSSDTNNYGVTAPFYIGSDNAAPASGYMNGYIRDFRLVKGTGLYASNFTPPTEPLTAIANTSLLACHAPYIADGSTNGNTITVINNPVTKRFGPYDHSPYTKADHGGSIYFDGSGDYLSISGPATGVGTWTLEGWFYFNTLASNRALFSQGTVDNTGGFIVWSDSNGIITFYSNGEIAQTSSGAVNANEWAHIAIVSNSNSITIFVNGVSAGTGSYSGSGTWFPKTFNNSPFQINRGYGGVTEGNNCYIADVRLVNNTAVYTSAFTPPTAPLTAIANTSLLTCTNKNDIWDAGSGNLLTKSGGVTGGANSGTLKFGQTAIYFDGSGDNLTISDLAMGSGDCTFEFWMYQNVAQSAAYRCMLAASTYASGIPFTIYTYSSNVQVWLSSSGSAEISGAFTASTWHHIALVRNSGTWTLYIDGTSAGTSTTGGSYGFAATTDWRFGENHSGSYDWDGYIQDARFTKGLARYTANFTPPTAEFDG